MPNVVAKIGIDTDETSLAKILKGDLSNVTIGDTGRQDFCENSAAQGAGTSKLRFMCALLSGSLRYLDSQQARFKRVLLRTRPPSSSVLLVTKLDTH